MLKPGCRRSWKRFNCIYRSRRLVWITFLLPSLAGVCLFWVLPFADVIRRSFTTAVTGEWNGLTNYGTVISNDAFLLAVSNTVRFVMVCIPLLLLFGLFIAVLLSRLGVMQYLKSLFLFPMAVPAATVVLVWKLIFDKNGFLNLLLDKGAALLGITAQVHVDYMGTGAAFWVLIASYLWKNLGYTVILWLAGIKSVSAEQLEAARVDGASERQCLYRIVLPQLKPYFYTITVLSLLNSFKVFREAYLVAGAYPQPDMYLLQHLFNNWFTRMELDKMAAGAVITGAVMFVGTLLLQRLWDRENEG